MPCKNVSLHTGPQIFQKSKNYLKILDTSRVKGSKFYTWDPQVLGTTVQISAIRVTWHLGFVHPCVYVPFCDQVGGALAISVHAQKCHWKPQSECLLLNGYYFKIEWQRMRVIFGIVIFPCSYHRQVNKLLSNWWHQYLTYRSTCTCFSYNL